MRHGCYNPEDSESARSVKRFIADDLFEKHLKVNEAAGKVNLSAERLYKYLNEGATNNNLPAYLMPIWNRMIGPELMMWLAHESGGAYMQLPQKLPEILDGVVTAARAMRECGEALESFSNGAADGHFSRKEIRELRKEIIEAVSALLVLEVVAGKMSK